MEKIITCKYCGQKLRIYSDKTGRVTCPKCNNSFLTNIDEAPQKKATFIDELKQRKPDIRTENLGKNPLDEACEDIICAVKRYVSDAMKFGQPAPILHHYYKFISYGYSDIPNDYLLDTHDFSAFTIGSFDFDILASKLKHIIINEIGYKKCEILLIDKTYSHNVPYTAKFSGETKYRKESKPGKAVWIHAAINESDFSKDSPDLSKKEDYNNWKDVTWS